MDSISRAPAWFRLMRLDKPAGVWLLYWPCAWSLLLAGGGVPWRLPALFLAGAVLMRGAGCLVNDLIDRDLDRQVARTRSRPLASGEVGIAYALALLVLLLLLSLAVAIALGGKVVLLSVFWLVPVGLYPFMKRITWWPQLFLGLTFSAGAPIGWTAATGEWPGLPAWLLFAGGVCWTLGYDTIYAHQDKIDDAAAGIRSTARRLGDRTIPFVALCYAAMLLLLGLAMAEAGRPVGSIIRLVPAAVQMGWQLVRVDLGDPASCWRIFRSNISTGAWVSLALLDP